MMRRTEPLVVNVFVAPLAGIGLHEELAGNFLLAVNLRRTREERSLGSIAFAAHVVGRHGGILDAASCLPTLPHIPRAVTDSGEDNQADCSAKNSGRGIRRQQSLPA